MGPQPESPQTSAGWSFQGLWGGAAGGVASLSEGQVTAVILTLGGREDNT